MERVKNQAMVQISEDSNFIKEVDLPRGQFREAAAIRCFQDVVVGQRCACGISSMDFQHTPENDAAQRHTFHNPDVYSFTKVFFIQVVHRQKCRFFNPRGVLVLS